MQTLEKALHQPMPFTTGGQTITDRLIAAKHSLAGSQLGKTICKATTEELMAPKKKHLDYLLHCTNEPNVSIPSMANLLIERTQNPNVVVVYKALITIHNLMCYGNERFSQYLASCNTSFNLTTFLDKVAAQGGNLASGYDMSPHVRRYGKYISEKIATYRLCAFDFCKVKRGTEDGLLRTLHIDKLLKTLPILQNQIDALLEFEVTSADLTNNVVNCSFHLLFRDLIRLYACYNDACINLLEKFFDSNKKQARDALELYKGFLRRLDKISAFLKLAETCGIERSEIPDLMRAPASLLETLENHLYNLEGCKGPPPQAQNFMAQHHVPQQQQHFNAFQQPAAGIDEATRQKYLEEEKERLRQYEEQRRKQTGDGGDNNPFAAAPPPAQSAPTGQQDLLNLFDTAPAPQQPPAADPNNPFGAFGAPASSQPGPANAPNPFGQFAPTQPFPPPAYSQPSAQSQAAFNPFGAPATTQSYAGYGQPGYNVSDNMYGQPNFFDNQPKTSTPPNQPGGNVDQALSSLVNNLSIHQQPGAPVGGVNWSGGPPPQNFAPNQQYPGSGQQQYPPTSYNPYQQQQPPQQQQWNPYQQQAPNPYQQQQPFQSNPFPQPNQQPGSAAPKDPFSLS